MKRALLIVIAGIVTFACGAFAQDKQTNPSKEDAERYHREQYNRIVETLKATLKKDPTVETFNVDTSTTHRIGAGKAA